MMQAFKIYRAVAFQKTFFFQIPCTHVGACEQSASLHTHPVQHSLTCWSDSCSKLLNVQNDKPPRVVAEGYLELVQAAYQRILVEVERIAREQTDARESKKLKVRMQFCRVIRNDVTRIVCS